jgi:methylthioxylose transferase
MQRLILRFLLVLAVAGTAVVLMNDRIPLGVPGEWTWDRIAIEPVTRIAAIVALLAGAIYLGFCGLGSVRIEAAGKLERKVWLLTLVGMAFAWWYVALDAVPAPHGYARVPWVLYYPGSSGYFWQARYEVGDVATFLAGYEEVLAEGDYLHIGTHPPGLTLGYCGLLRLCHAYPSLTEAVLKTQPPSVTAAVATIRESPLEGVPELSRADEACLWLALLVTQSSAALALLGIYGLAVRHHDRRAAWGAACLWPVVPAVAVFFPKSDVLLVLPAICATWLWMSACDRGSILRATVCGLIVWLGMMLSLAFLTIMALIGVMTIWEVCTRPPEWKHRPFLQWHLFFGAALGFALPTLILWFVADINLLRVWEQNFVNHASFYEHNVRTYRTWLQVNPIELALAVGLPLMVAAVFACWRVLRTGLLSPRFAPAAAFGVVWGLLWLSGKNMGEAARLWILIMPWVVLMAAPALTGPPEGAGDETSRRIGPWGPWLMISQCLVAVMTILRVDGFHFSQLLGL